MNVCIVTKSRGWAEQLRNSIRKCDPTALVLVCDDIDLVENVLRKPLDLMVTDGTCRVRKDGDVRDVYFVPSRKLTSGKDVPRVFTWFGCVPDILVRFRVRQHLRRHLSH